MNLGGHLENCQRDSLRVPGLYKGPGPQGGGPDEGSFRGGTSDKGVHVTGGGTDTQGEKELPRNWPC